jgi:hypothetical protein
MKYNIIVTNDKSLRAKADWKEVRNAILRLWVSLHTSGVHYEFIGRIVYRLMEHSTVTTDVSSLRIQRTSPPCLTGSTSVITKPSLLLSYR